jgi:hypothetical protein
MNTMSDVICSLPQTTVRPMVFNDEKITDELIIGYLGKTQKIETKCQPRTEVVVPIVQALEDKQFRRVHSLTLYKTVLGVSIGGLPPDYSDGSHIGIFAGRITTTTVWNSSAPMCTFLNYGKGWTYVGRSPEVSLLTVYSKHGALFKAEYKIKNGVCVIHSVTPKHSSTGIPTALIMSPQEKCTFKTGRLVAFDGSSSGEKFVFVEKIKTRRSKKQVVRLYKPGNQQPVATYTPPNDTFEPTDVCFWHFEDEDKLLIADWQNDAIHVVDTKDDYLKFERYLAPGSGHLFKPTALNLDGNGNVLVGCENGWILRIEKVSPQEEPPKHDDDEDTSSFSALSAANASESTATNYSD